MGIYDYMSATVDSIKRNTPNLTAVKGICWYSYDYSRAAVTNIHSAVTVNGKAVVEKVNQNLPDQETRSEIATNLVKNSASFAVNEGLKLVPGGSAVANIVYRSLPNDKTKLQKNKDLLELKDKVERLEKELRDYEKLLDKTEIQKPTVELKSKSTLDLHQKPEDVIRAFMMTEFMSNHFLDGLIVPEIRSRNHR
ncbi:hypothetical protein KPL70_026555 [Citrus sinensis]|uniref:Uncharacterized protein n=1 Tax=Citrus sinensis TaxID=2711 RepID=A0A067G3L2_CITSI|nr:uncharacterized protein LOC102629203 [Citrus sinensis]KAH9650923.1 hypothetical protein KPL70_026555 [Citrus sinensis]KDO74199.1 hypothetical protein CISIN_1g029387mg [Citrus sinensis]GAY52496.1 hypothetical protein CUMW_142280 [Citrus unshiu]